MNPYGLPLYPAVDEFAPAAREAIYGDEDRMAEIRAEVVSDPEDLDTAISALVDARWMLAQLFEHDITLSQLFERNAKYPERIEAMRNLLRTATNISAAVDRKVEAEVYDMEMA